MDGIVEYLSMSISLISYILAIFSVAIIMLIEDRSDYNSFLYLIPFLLLIIDLILLFILII